MKLRFPEPDVDQMRRHAAAITSQPDPVLEFRTPHDRAANLPEHRHLLRPLTGRLTDPGILDQLGRRQRRGAGVHVCMAETDGLGLKAINMTQPRCVWIEDDLGAVDASALPLRPTITVETSVIAGIRKRHVIWRVRGLSWPLWSGVQLRMIQTYGSDPNAASIAQVLRLAGTWHQKDPAAPQLVRIVDEHSSGIEYDPSEVELAFAPVQRPASVGRHEPGTAEHWEIDAVRRQFDQLNGLLELAGGRVVLTPSKPGDETYIVDWDDRDWWFIAVSAIHHATAGSDEGEQLAEELSAASAKFDRQAQAALWRSLNVARSGGSITMGTITYVIRRLAAFVGQTGQSGPVSRPPAHRELSGSAKPVLAWGQQVLAVGTPRFLAARREQTMQSFKVGSLKARLLTALTDDYFSPRLGVAIVGSLFGLAQNLASSRPSVRKTLRELAREGQIIKSSGAECSIPVEGGSARRGILIGLKLADEVMSSLQAATRESINAATRDTAMTPSAATRATDGAATPILQGGYEGAEEEHGNSASGTEHGQIVIGNRAERGMPPPEPPLLPSWSQDVPNPYHYAVTTTADRTTLEWWIIRDAFYPSLRSRLLAIEEEDPSLVADTLQALRDLADSGIEAIRWNAAVTDAVCAVVTSYEWQRGRRKPDTNIHFAQFSLRDVPIPFIARELPKALARTASYHRKADRWHRRPKTLQRIDYKRAKDPG